MTVGEEQDTPKEPIRVNYIDSYQGYLTKEKKGSKESKQKKDIRVKGSDRIGRTVIRFYL